MCRRDSPHWSNQLKHCSVILEWKQPVANLRKVNGWPFIIFPLELWSPTFFPWKSMVGSDVFPIEIVLNIGDEFVRFWSSFYNQAVEIQPLCPIGTRGSKTNRTASAGPKRAMGCPTANCGRLVPATRWIVHTTKNPVETKHNKQEKDIHPRKTNMDTQNDGLEKVTPFKNCNVWYLC